MKKSKAELVQLLLDAQIATQTSLEDERQRQLRRMEEAIESISDAFVLYDSDGIGIGMHRLRAREKEKENFILELTEAISEVKKLSGMLPICASRKKIRDDKSYWNQIESYIGAHSKAEFSHGICPDCAKKLYPELYNGD